MKKILFAMAAVLMLTACDSKADYDAINAKIEKGQALSKSDYSAIIDYVVEGAQALNEAAEKIDYESGDFQAIENANKKYPYYQTFSYAVSTADESMISSEDRKKLRKLEAAE